MLEILWNEMQGLKSIAFNQYMNLSKKEYKRRKTPATIEGSITMSCECHQGDLVFENNAIFRKELSWFSGSIPPTTKETILNTCQGEFDIIEWHARLLQLELNKQKLTCNSKSITQAWEIYNQFSKDCLETRKAYNS